MTKVEELIQKVRDGKVTILNDGTIEQLKEVLGWCFPKDNCIINGTNGFYRVSLNLKEKWVSGNGNFLPTVSAKEFYEDEFVFGEEVEVSYNGFNFDKGTYCCKYPLSKRRHIVLHQKDPYSFYHIRKLPLKTKLTHQMIADKFGIDVNNLEII